MSLALGSSITNASNTIIDAANRAAARAGTVASAGTTGATDTSEVADASSSRSTARRDAGRKQAPPPGYVATEGARLVLDGKDFRVFGVNYPPTQTISDGSFFRDGASDAEIASLRTYFRNARELGANTVRIPLQLFHLVERDADGGVSISPERKQAIRTMLDLAEAEGVKLLVIGNVIWKPQDDPQPWYDAMSNEERWQVQADFWRDVAETAADSPAVLAYELSAEPAVAADPDKSWYNTDYAGYHFTQNIARGIPLDQQSEVAREWVKTLTAAVRKHDPHHLVTVGQLPFWGGPTGGKNLALAGVDLISLHTYPEGKAGDPDAAKKSIDLVKQHKETGIPVLISETAKLHADGPTMEKFFTEIHDDTVGGITQWDGERLADWKPTDMVGALHKSNVEHFVSMRPIILGPAHVAREQGSLLSRIFACLNPFDD